MSLTHILSQEGQLSQYYEDERERNEQKQILSRSKERIDPALIEKGLQYPGVTSNGSCFAFLKLDLSGRDLLSVLGLESYIHLQEINLSCNQLSTLKPLSDLKHLCILNASYNQLHKMFDFSAPANLQYADYSNNLMTKIEGACKHRYLKTLILDSNKIAKIEGLSKNICLSTLSLQNNEIQFIEDLENLNIETLNLAQNKIKMINGVSTLKKLTRLDLSRNDISKLKGLEQNEYLRFLDMSGNKIDKVRQVTYIEDLPLLTEFDLSFNPIQGRKYYRFQILFKVSQLRKLDGVNITAKEKVKAENLHGTDLEDRKTIFKTLLPEEEFVDRRIKRSSDIDPESDSSAEEKLADEMNIISGGSKQGSAIGSVHDSPQALPVEDPFDEDLRDDL